MKSHLIEIIPAEHIIANGMERIVDMRQLFGTCPQAATPDVNVA
jgi:hypothetical protein